MTGAASMILLLVTGLSQSVEPEQIPTKPKATMPPVESMSFIRQSMYDRWQYYAVDRGGSFRARVVLSYPEPFYLVNGRPYPFLSVRPRDFSTHTTD
jgi:hypothetical protein